MKTKTKKELIEAVEGVKQLFDDGVLPFILHLPGGNEDQLIDLFKDIKEEDYIFGTHRACYQYLLKGASTEELHDKIKDGKSMFLFDKKYNFLSSSILAGTAGIAAGVALALKLENKPGHVWSFHGDGGEDEGHLYEGVRFVQSMDLPCTFVIEDNNMSCDSSREDRNSTCVINWPDCVRRYHYETVYPHCGVPSTKMVTFDPNIVEKFKT